MKKYTLRNYAESGAAASSALLNLSGLVDSGLVDSGITDSGVTDSGVVSPDDKEFDPKDSSSWDRGSYTEEEMNRMIEEGTWKGGYVNGEYIMPVFNIIGGGSTSSGEQPGSGQGTSIPGGGSSSQDGNTWGYGGGSSTGGNVSGDGMGGNSDNATDTSTNGVITYVDGVPVYSYDYALSQINKGFWSGGFVMGADPNSPMSIAYTYSDGTVYTSTSNEQIGQNDVLDKSQWLSQGHGDCRKTCQAMQKNAGYTSSDGQFIPMTMNRDDKPYAPDARFQEGLNYLDSELQKGRAVIVGVDWKINYHTGNLDHASDHFILVVGRYVIAGSVFYHYFDPGTQIREKGTRSENVLQIKDGYLVGDYINTPDNIHHYVVTRVNYNKDL